MQKWIKLSNSKWSQGRVSKRFTSTWPSKETRSKKITMSSLLLPNTYQWTPKMRDPSSQTRFKNTNAKKWQEWKCLKSIGTSHNNLQIKHNHSPNNYQIQPVWSIKHKKATIRHKMRLLTNLLGERVRGKNLKTKC